MRRTIQLGVAALAAGTLALTGCGRDGGDGGAAGPAEAESVAEGEATGTIQVWAMGAEGENLASFAQGFVDENPGVQVDVTAVPWDAAHDKIATAIAAGQTPDVSMIGTTWQGEFGATGALDPTPDLIDSDSFFPGAWEGTQVGGTSYGVPWYVETRVLYYRSDMVAEAPTDWDGLKAMAQQMQDAGAEYGFSAQPGGTGAWQTFMPFAWQSGAQLTTEDGTEFTIDSPEFVEALEFYQSIFEEGYSPTDLPQGELEPGFVEGRIGSFVSGPWHVGILEDTGGEEAMSTLGLTTLPYSAGPSSFIGGANLAVFQDSQNRDTAWKFVEWLSRPEVQAAWYETVNALPSVASAWEDPAIADDEYLAVFGEQLESATAPPAIPTWEEVASVIDRELERLTKTGADPQEVATAIQQQASSIGTGL